MTGDVTAIVLAGGRGTRIQALYPDLPKPLVPAAGQPFLHWVVAWLEKQGIDDVVISSGYRAEQIDAWVAQTRRPNAELRTCRETEPLGTGGGTLQCLDHARDLVLVLNGDSLLVTQTAPLLAWLKDPEVESAIMGVPV